MSTAQSLSYLVSSHHGSGTSLLSSHSHSRHRPLDRQWVVMPLLSLLLTDSTCLSLKNDLLQTSSFCSSWEQCVTTCGEVGRCWVTCFLCAWATCLSLLVWVFSGIEDRTRDCQHVRWMLYHGVTWTSSVLCDLIRQALILSRVILPFILVSIGEPSLRIWCLLIHLPVLSKRKG